MLLTQDFTSQTLPSAPGWGGMYSPGSDGDAFNIAACQPSRSPFELEVRDVGDAAGVVRVPAVGLCADGVRPEGPSVAPGALAPLRMPPLLSPPPHAMAI